MTSGNGSTASGDWPHRFMALSQHNVFNGGVSGETSTQIKTRMLADTGKYQWRTVIWAGRNNITSPTTVKADIAAMVAALGHTNYIIISILNQRNVPVEYSGGADYITITQLNADLAATYGAHFVDARSYLVSLYDPNTPADVIDHGRDTPPSTLMNADNLHLNNVGYQAVANLVYANRAQLGFN